MKKQDPELRGGFEPVIYRELKNAKVKVTYEEDRLPYVTHHSYVPDFKVSTLSGSVFYLEVKGYFRTADQVKMRAVKQANPDLDIRFVFQRDNKLNKHSKMTYSLWAAKYGFPCSIGTVPLEWLM